MGNKTSQLKQLDQSFQGPNKEIVLASNTGLYFPHEILLEILSRLIVEDILRYKCVCKQWYAIIQDRQFVEMHMKRSTIIFYFQSVDETFQSRHACDGLLLEKSKNSGEYRIRNPTMKKILVLPNPHHESFVVAISFRPSTGTYIVISIYNGREEDKKGGCKVLDIGSENLSWRPLEISNFANLNRESETISTLFIHEIYHCDRVYEDGSGDCEIVSIDLNKEGFTSLKIFWGWRKVRLMRWNRKPSLAGVVRDELHVWVLEDLEKQKWADSKIVVPLKFLIENPSTKELLAPYLVQNGKVWLRVGYNKMLLCCIKMEKVEATICAPQGESISCFYKTTLNTLKGMQAEKKKIEFEIAHLLRYLCLDLLFSDI